MFHELLTDLIAAATSSVFSIMLGQEVEVGPSVLETAGTGPSNGVAAVVGIAGAYSGTGGVVCSTDVACSLAGMMMLSEYSAIDDEVLDSMGEIANMIVGNVKTEMESRFGPMGLSTPTVIYGRNFATRSAGTHTWTVVPFTFAGKHFVVQMMLTASSPGGRGPVLPTMVTVCQR